MHPWLPRGSYTFTYSAKNSQGHGEQLDGLP